MPTRRPPSRILPVKAGDAIRDVRTGRIGRILEIRARADDEPWYRIRWVDGFEPCVRQPRSSYRRNRCSFELIPEETP